jgi:anti-anti-sigma regulatory factor
MPRRPNYLPALQLQLSEEFTRSGVPVTLVVCSGSLTGEDGARLRDQLLVVLRHGPRHLLLDLAEATTFDNAAAATLIDTHRRAPLLAAASAWWRPPRMS